jgi:hypothetical protein
MKQTKKIMTKWTRVNNIFSYVECARPSTLREAKALAELGYCVEDLTEEIMKKFLDVFEYSLSDFFAEYSCREVRDYIAPDITINEAIREDKTIWVSDREGEDAWVIPKGELKDFFEMYLDNVNKDIIQDALSLLNEKEDWNEWWDRQAALVQS